MVTSIESLLLIGYGEFWYMAKMNINIFCLLMQNFIELYELYECPVNSSFRNAEIFRKHPKHQMFGVPPNTLP